MYTRMLRYAYHGITLCSSWCYVIHITSFGTPFLEPPILTFRIFPITPWVVIMMLFGGECSQSLSLDYSSIFQSKFMMKQLFFVQRVLLFRSMTSLVCLSLVWLLVRVSIHDIFGHIIYRGPETGQNGHFSASLHPALHIHPSITY